MMLQELRKPQDAETVHATDEGGLVNRAPNESPLHRVSKSNLASCSAHLWKELDLNKLVNFDVGRQKENREWSISGNTLNKMVSNQHLFNDDTLSGDESNVLNNT